MPRDEPAGLSIYAVLERDHARIDALLERLRGADAMRRGAWRRALDELREAVRAHERAEEHSIFPLLLHDEQMRDEAVRAREEQRDAESLLDELAFLEPTDERFAWVRTELEELLRSHFRREEERLVPRAQELVSDAEAERFARRVELDRVEESPWSLIAGAPDGFSLPPGAAP